MIKVMSVFGTRPEAIKMAPVVKEIERTSGMSSIVVVTGQNREMLDQVLDLFDLHADHNLDIMEKNQTLTTITTKILSRLDVVIDQEKPDFVLVHGDTTSTMAASLSAFYHQIPIAHVEAGLRTWDKYSPYPEEMNRQLTDRLSDIYFAPTTLSEENLLKEGIQSSKIAVTGNTVIDAMQYTIDKSYNHDVLSQIPSDHKIILLTMHRRENQGQPMANVFQAVNELTQLRPDVDVIYPVHLSPAVQTLAHDVFDNNSQVHLIDPLNVVDFHNLMSRSYFVMTDSGGVQEEAPSLNKPVLVLRDATERPEGVDAGTLKVIGTDKAVVLSNMLALLTDNVLYQKMAIAKNPYGDGKASQRIVSVLQHYSD